MPHPEVALERLLVDVEEVVIRGDAASGMHVRERLELGQLGLRQRLRVADQRQHLLAPLLVEALPVLVVVERALLEFLRAARDLRRIGDGVAADVDAAVDDAVIDAERRRQAVHARVRGAERAVRRLRRHHVEGRHRLREVHGVVEPEAVVVRRGELDVVRDRPPARASVPGITLSELGTGKPLGLAGLSMTRTTTHTVLPHTLLVARGRRRARASCGECSTGRQSRPSRRGSDRIDVSPG